MACLAASQATGSHLRRREGLRDPSAPAKRSGPEERRSLLPTLPLRLLGGAVIPLTPGSPPQGGHPNSPTGPEERAAPEVSGDQAPS